MRPYPLSISMLLAAVSLGACSNGSSTLAPVRPTASPTATAPTATPTASPVPTATPIATATPTASPTPTATPVPTPTPTATAQPQVVHIGFNHTGTTDPTFGAINFYTGASGASAPAAVVTVMHGSSLLFTNDDTATNHTASGLGSSFPASFDNTGGTTQTGSTIDGGTTWSTGTLRGGSSSVVFTVGPPGNYFFGCFYHYNDAEMRDVIVSQ